MTDTQPTTQTALDIWNIQTQALANPALADAAINAIYENLMGLHGKLKKNGNETAAAKVEEAYNQALAIYNMTTRQADVIAGGSAAITEVDAQRQKAVTELAQIFKALENGDESHPRLVEFASSIREEEQMDSYEMAYQEMDENVTEQIVDAWNVDWQVADRMWMTLLGRPEPALTDAQTALFQAFVDSLKADEDEDGDE